MFIRLTKTFAVIFLLLIPAKFMGQSIIVTLRQDSVHCNITGSDERFTYYETAYTKRGKQEVISNREIAEILDTDRPVIRQRPGMISLNWSKFRFGGYGGLSLFLASDLVQGSDGSLEEYYRDRNLGYRYAFDVVYMLDESFGLGMYAGFSRYGNSVNIIDQNSGMTGRLKDDIRIGYFAAQFTADFLNEPSGSGLSVAGGVGLVRYSNDFELFAPFDITGFGFGLHLGMSYRLVISPGVMIPLFLGIKGFSVSNMDLTPPRDAPDDVINGVTALIRSGWPTDVTRVEFGTGLIISF